MRSRLPGTETAYWCLPPGWPATWMKFFTLKMPGTLFARKKAISLSAALFTVPYNSTWPFRTEMRMGQIAAKRMAKIGVCARRRRFVDVMLQLRRLMYRKPGMNTFADLMMTKL